MTPNETAGTLVGPDAVLEMIAEYEAGASLISIARERRVCKETVRDLLVEAGVRIRRQGLDEEQVKHAVMRYEGGLTTREVARELGVGQFAGLEGVEERRDRVTSERTTGWSEAVEMIPTLVGAP